MAKGIQIGKIMATGTESRVHANYEEDDMTAILADMHLWIEVLCQHIDVEVKDLVALCRTMLCGFHLQEFEAFTGYTDDEALRMLLGIFAKVTRFRREWPDLMYIIQHDVLVALEVNIDEILSTQEQMSWGKVMLLHLRSFLIRRRFIITEKKDLAMGYKAGEPGDLLVVLFGCATPYILRKVEDYYLYIGEVHIDGYMNGEGMGDLEAGRYSPEWYFIR
jgi:hypothetical protein